MNLPVTESEGNALGLGPIPRRIIQTGKSLNLPLLHRAAISSIKGTNPEFEYQFFDDKGVDDFIRTEFRQYQSVFDNFQFKIQKYDFFRYLVIYRFGGFYFDLDVLLAASLLPLLERTCVFSFEALTVSRFLREKLGMNWLIGNYGFGACAGHPFLRAIIENCVKSQNEPSWVKPMKAGSPPLLADEFTILNTTGPGIVSRTYAENPSLRETVSILLPEDACDLRNWNCFGEFGIHLMNSSWRKRRNYFLHKTSDVCWRWIQRKNIDRARRLGQQRPSCGTLNTLSGC